MVSARRLEARDSVGAPKASGRRHTPPSSQPLLLQDRLGNRGVTQLLQRQIAASRATDRAVAPEPAGSRVGDREAQLIPAEQSLRGSAASVPQILRAGGGTSKPEPRPGPIPEPRPDPPRAGTTFNYNFLCDQDNRTRNFSVTGTSVTVVSHLAWDRGNCGSDEHWMTLWESGALLFSEGTRSFTPGHSETWTGLSPGTYYLMIHHNNTRCCLTGSIGVT
jgi:hypothetical protein